MVFITALWHWLFLYHDSLVDGFGFHCLIVIHKDIEWFVLKEEFVDFDVACRWINFIFFIIDFPAFRVEWLNALLWLDFEDTFFWWTFWGTRVIDCSWLNRPHFLDRGMFYFEFFHLDIDCWIDLFMPWYILGWGFKRMDLFLAVSSTVVSLCFQGLISLLKMLFLLF